MSSRDEERMKVVEGKKLLKDRWVDLVDSVSGMNRPRKERKKAGFRIRIDLMRIRIRIRIQHFF